jgi:hypothetical protein
LNRRSPKTRCFLSGVTFNELREYYDDATDSSWSVCMEVSDLESGYVENDDFIANCRAYIQVIDKVQIREINGVYSECASELTEKKYSSKVFIADRSLMSFFTSLLNWLRSLFFKRGIYTLYLIKQNLSLRWLDSRTRERRRW